jgi:uncharacterized protein YciI
VHPEVATWRPFGDGGARRRTIFKATLDGVMTPVSDNMTGAMGKQHYFVKLIPPRPTFPFDMTSEERTLMMEHVKYTQEKFAAGKALIFGPVMASEGAFGMAVFEVADEAELRAIVENDPTVRAGLNKFELHPMKLGAAQASQPD